VHAATSQHRDRNKCPEEADIKKNGEESEEGKAAKEACHKGSEGSVDHSSAGYALNSFHPCWDLLVMSVQICWIISDCTDREGKEKEVTDRLGTKKRCRG